MTVSGVVLPYSHIQICKADTTDDSLPGEFMYTDDHMPTFEITLSTMSEIAVGGKKPARRVDGPITSARPCVRALYFLQRVS